MARPLRMIGLKRPTLEDYQVITVAAESGPDALTLTGEKINGMVPFWRLRGHPKLANKKQLVSIR